MVSARRSKSSFFVTSTAIPRTDVPSRAAACSICSCRRETIYTNAHYSNIEYIDNALSSYDIELIHFVDPALMYRVTSDENFKEANAQNKVKEQIEWIAQCNVDAILITCTNYIAI
ncbi:hypothetical protein V7306_17495, partial [Neobacillus vireti]